MAMALYAIFGAVLLIIIYYSLKEIDRPYAGFEVVSLNDNKGSSAVAPKSSDFRTHARSILEKGRNATNGKCFQVKTGTGYKIIVPGRFAHELRNNPNLDMAEAARLDFMADYHGFDGVRETFRKDKLMVEVVRVRLTQSLGLITDDLVDETSYAMHHWFNNSLDWRTYSIKNVILDVVTRVSSRAFTGEELARNDAWLDVAKNYAVNTFQGNQELRKLLPILRPLAQWSIPMLQKLRAQAREARILVRPIIEKQLQQRQAAIESGEKVAKAGNAFAWMAEQAKGRRPDFAAGQLMLSLAAIHTTTEVMTRCILQLCDAPGLVGTLREEVLRVLKDSGWSKASFHKMKLLDSFMNEVLRYNPMMLASMIRMVKAQVQLSDGTVLPKGSRILILNDAVQDPNIYSEPDKFDAYRFLNLRNSSGGENKHQFVTTSHGTLGFGHGEHACPGRFFASNEIKILLCFFLLQYDLQYEPGYSRPDGLEFETGISVNPVTKIQVRKREPEVDLMNTVGG